MLFSTFRFVGTYLSPRRSTSLFIVNPSSRGRPLTIISAPLISNLAKDIGGDTLKRFRSGDWDDMEPSDAAMDTGADVIRVARRVYVGNLPYRYSWQDLKDYFAKVGTVRYANILREGGPGSRSKGCGIVEFETAEEAARAIQELNNTEIGGRNIFVREDREDYELKNANGGGSAVGGGRPAHKRPRAPVGRGGAVAVGRRVWVGNLDPMTTWQQLKDHFKQAGHVVHADIMVDAQGASKGCGIVEFSSSRDALHSISLLSNSVLPGTDRSIMVREDREDPIAAKARAPPPPRPAPEGTCIVVHGLPWRYAWQDLKDLAKQYGTVVRSDIMENPDGTSKGYGLIVFNTKEEAAAALENLNGMECDGRTLSAKYDKFSGAPK